MGPETTSEMGSPVHVVGTLVSQEEKFVGGFLLVGVSRRKQNFVLLPIETNMTTVHSLLGRPCQIENCLPSLLANRVHKIKYNPLITSQLASLN